jgi:signal transduction histidine kinase
MGKVDGYLTLASLRSEPVTAAVPFILMTGLADNAGMRHGMELGADDYLPKPFTLDALYAAVDARLKKARALKGEAERQLAALRSNITLMLPHELRTPLNGIVALSEILAEDASNLSSSEIADMGQTILKSSKRLERLIENFLIYAQIELLSTDSQRIDSLRQSRCAKAAEVVARCAQTQAERAGRPADLKLDLAPATLRISEEHLGRIVDELAHNAFKFSPPGTPVGLDLAVNAATAVLRIQNEGKGFTAEHISRVGAYMQFDRKLHEQQGLGLGLAIAKRLVEIHGGALALQGGTDNCAVVVVRLPAEAVTEARFAE